MAANGNLIFQDTNKATFVGANSNVVIDTVKSSLGIGVDVDGPTSNLHIIGNCFVSTDLTASTLSGNGSGLTALNATTITTGTLPVARGGTGTTTSTGTGSVVLSAAPAFTGDVTFDTDTLFVDSVNNRVGVGTTNPQYRLDVGHGGGATSADDVMLRVMSSSGTSGKLIFGRSGTTDIRSHAIESYNTSGSQNNYMKFLVHDGTGTAPYETRTEVMTLLGSGNVGIGTTSPQQKLDLGDLGGGSIRLGRDHDDNTSTNRIGRTGVGNATWYASVNFLDENTNDDAISFVTHQGNVGIAERMRISGNGNVGIGTTIPQTSLQIKDETDTTGTGDGFITGLNANSGNRKPTECLRLQGKYHAAGSGPLLRFTNFHTSGSNPSNDEYNLGGIAGFDYASAWGGGLCFYTAPNTAGGGDLTARMVIDSSGYIGFGTASPVSRMHHKQAADQSASATLSSYQNGLVLERSGTSDRWCLANDIYGALTFYYNTSRKGWLQADGNDGRINFTGQHRTFIKDVPFTQAEELKGLIVSADINKYIRMSGGIEAGSNAITVNESLPIVSISTKVKDKKCFGVISASEDPEKRQEQHGNFVSDQDKESGDTRVYINSVGEGAIWVTNINGSLESGDYITTSSVGGYGQKQDSDSLKNYTVAKITMDCDFSPVTQPIQNIKKDETGENTLDEHGQIQWEDHPTETEKAYKIRYLDASGSQTDEANHVHKAAFVGCTYHCG